MRLAFVAFSLRYKSFEIAKVTPTTQFFVTVIFKKNIKIMLVAKNFNQLLLLPYTKTYCIEKAYEKTTKKTIQKKTKKA